MGIWSSLNSRFYEPIYDGVFEDFFRGMASAFSWLMIFKKVNAVQIMKK
jgi:hypothetical protein